MEERTSALRWMLGIVVILIGAAIAIPMYRFADLDDAPGGMVIAVLVFVCASGLASWIVYRNPASGRQPPA
jgi:hypothetical protein